MKQLEKLIDRIINRVNINLREPAFDVAPAIRHIIPPAQFGKFYAFYGLTSHHPLYFRFKWSSLAGSYFLGKCIVDYSVLYKSDIRGDELKSKGQVFSNKGLEIPLHDDEVIHIKDSFLIKTLVHSFSHDPENLEEFLIQNTASLHYANIHGSTVEGCFLAPFATVDLTTVHDCVIGDFAYVQVGELSHRLVEPGTIWVRNGETFDFRYRYPGEVLRRYIDFQPGRPVGGMFIDFINARKPDFQKVYEQIKQQAPIPVPFGAALNNYAVVKGATRLQQNCLVAQRAYLEDAWLGKGANAQENCFIIQSRLEERNVTAHGGKVICAHLGKKVICRFQFLFARERGLSFAGGGRKHRHAPHDHRPGNPPGNPPNHIVWGYIRNARDLKEQGLSLASFSRIKKDFRQGALRFQGNGAAFVEAFRNRIEHILEANGAYFNGVKNRGHAQKNQDISFNTIQPYAKGALKGLYPTIEIQP